MEDNGLKKIDWKAIRASITSPDPLPWETDEQYGKRREQERLQSRIKMSNMPPHTRRECRFRTFIKRDKSCSEALRLAQDFAAGKRQHHFFTLTSEVRGAGKTHLAFAIGWDFVERGIPILFYQAGELLDYLRQGYHLDSKESIYDFDTRINMMMKQPLLIIDDLGTEQSTPWAMEKLGIIINSRWLNKRLTVITTNCLPEKLEARIQSRIIEGVCFTIESSDYRRLRAKKREAAARNA